MEVNKTGRVKVISKSSPRGSDTSDVNTSPLSSRTESLTGDTSGDSAGVERNKANNKGPAELFEACCVSELDAVKFDLTAVKFELSKALLFYQPLFEAAPVIEDSSVLDRDTDLKIREQLWDGSKYRDLLELLRVSNTRESRLFIFAWWLKQENVCEPEDILGREEIQRLTRKRLGFLSKSEFEHACRVRAWLPYFERLLKDLKTKSRAELVRSGYEHTAVEASYGKLSAVEAVCSWLSDRPPICDALTLRNAFSKIYGRKRLQPKEYPLLDKVK